MMIENSKKLVKFEILCVDQKGEVEFSDEDRFITAIQYNEKICSKNTAIKQDGVSGFYDEQRKIDWSIQKIVKFFITKIGLDWWGIAVNEKAKRKYDIRAKERAKELIFLKSKKDLVDADVESIDFNDLGDIIFQQKTAFSDVEEIIKKIENSKKLEDLTSFIQGNYAKYFKEYFEEKDFKTKWNRCFEIRNKVAHNYLFTKQDLDDAICLINELQSIINNADKEIDRAVFSLAEKEALINTASMLVDSKQSDFDNSNSESDTLQREIRSNHANSSDDEKYYNRVISEEEVIEQLRITESRFRDGFVGLRFFVTDILKKQGYAPSISCAVINVLSDKQKIKIYDVDNPNGNFPTKAVELMNKEE